MTTVAGTISTTVRTLHPIALSTLGLVLAACGENTPNPPDMAPEQRSTAMPTIYIDQIVEPYAGAGHRDMYEEMVAACNETDLPLREISAAEKDLLGKARVQRWFAPDKAGYRWESWHYRQGNVHQRQHCQFHLVSTGRHVFIDRSGLYSIQLDDNEPFDTVPLSDRDAGYLSRLPLEDSRVAEGPTRQVAGQECVEIPVPGYEEARTCTWTGGGEWGFDVRSLGQLSVAIASHSDFFRTVILEQRSAGLLPDQITTQRFSIGEALDESAMQPAPATAWPAKLPLP
ncbi:hypothetical protein [Halomonas sp. A29]|uniref:hypothetical protein n=1 Tax=Halomonas sp. A29 TaxID=3102786 RepID=UPI00398ABDB1